MSLELRQRRLAVQYCLKVSSDTSNPALSCIFNKCFTAFFQIYPCQICPVGFHVSSDLHAIHFTQKDIFAVVTPSHPHGFTPNLFLICLLISMQSHTSPDIFQSIFLAVCDELSDYRHIYTDGSKMNNGVAAAAVSLEEVKSLHILDKASIFTTELVALNLALDIVWHSRHERFVIFSDFLSCLFAIQNLQAESG